MKGFVVGAPCTGAGKTTVVLGLIAALRQNGVRVQPFKVGPDFIDPGLHRIVSGRTSYNLDIWMSGTGYVKELFYRKTLDVDVAIVEGVMGVYDGGESSTASLCKLLGLPLVLVIDAHNMAESAAAVVKGIMELENLEVIGVVLNRVSSKRHHEILKDSIERYTGVPVIGYLHPEPEIRLPERHLGLYTASEIDASVLKGLARRVGASINISVLLERTPLKNLTGPTPSTPVNPKVTRLAVARDRAFSFYYEDTFEQLSERGVECIPFSPLADSSLPDKTAGVYLGGGYPELYLSELSENRQMKRAIRDFVERGGVVYAECGGFMYLMQGIYDIKGKFFPLAGVFPVKARMRNDGFSIGYREIRLKKNTILGNKGDRLRGHEFHYSEIVEMAPEIEDVYTSNKRLSKPSQGGFLVKNCLGSYIHLHLASNQDALDLFVNALKTWLSQK